MSILLTLIAIFILLCINEFWWRRQKRPSEFSRKFIHITIGSFTAFWPFYLSFTDIKYLSLAGLVVLALSKYLNIFKAIHAVERTTWGEICSALSVGLLAFLTHNKWLFAACILQMALADGLAAIIGVAYGSNTRYKVFGHVKSLIGSLIFFVTSLVILFTFRETDHISHGLAYLGLTSLVASGLENVGIKGLDNLLVPVAVLLMIHH